MSVLTAPDGQGLVKFALKAEGIDEPQFEQSPEKSKETKKVTNFGYSKDVE